MKIVDGWVVEAQEYNLTTNSMDRAGYKPTHLTLHGTGGGRKAAAVAEYMGGAGVSTHLVIGYDSGEIVQCVSMNRAAWGNGSLINPRLPFSYGINPNLYTISIEHCKPNSDNSNELTQVQKASSFALIKAICEYYGIPKRKGDARGGIVSHADFDSVNRARCPGPYPWDELFSYLNGNSASVEEEERMIILAKDTNGYFTAEGDVWKCKNGFVVKGAILAFYREVGQYGMNGLTDLGLPLANEGKLQDQVWIQEFERGIVICDPLGRIDKPPYNNGSCYKAHIDNAKYNPTLKAAIDRAVKVEKQAAELTTQASDLKKQVATTQSQVVELQKTVVELQDELNALPVSTPDTKAKEAIENIKAIVNQF